MKLQEMFGPGFGSFQDIEKQAQLDAIMDCIESNDELASKTVEYLEQIAASIYEKSLTSKTKLFDHDYSTDRGPEMMLNKEYCAELLDQVLEDEHITNQAPDLDPHADSEMAGGRMGTPQ